MTSGVSKTCGITGAAIALFIFHFVFARDLFPSVPGNELSYGWDRAIVTIFVSGIGAVVGALFGSVIERLASH